MKKLRFVLSIALALGLGGCVATSGGDYVTGGGLETMWATTEIKVVNGTPYTIRVTASGQRGFRIVEPGSQAEFIYTNYFRDYASINVTVTALTPDKKVAGTAAQTYGLSAFGRQAYYWHVVYVEPPRSS